MTAVKGETAQKTCDWKRPRHASHNLKLTELGSKVKVRQDANVLIISKSLLLLSAIIANTILSTFLLPFPSLCRTTFLVNLFPHEVLFLAVLVCRGRCSTTPRPTTKLGDDQRVMSRCSSKFLHSRLTFCCLLQIIELLFIHSFNVSRAMVDRNMKISLRLH